MVLGVCRRIIGNLHDADDAFQATFLVLVRKAGSIRPREAVGNWLYGVAYRTSLQARARLSRRRAKEQPVRDMPQPESKSGEVWHEVQPLLDYELRRLSDRYRLPVVLCDLEGRCRKEVARQLQIPEGTLSSRLAMARKLLAHRLRRRGVSLCAGGLAALLAHHGASAAVPAALLHHTTKAALVVAVSHVATAGAVPVQVAALTEGVLKTMLLAKLKTVTMVMAGVAAVGLGTGGLMYQARAVGFDPDKLGSAPAVAQASQDKAGEETPKEKELREALQRAVQQARALRDELQAVRQEAEMQRQRADEERRRAQEARDLAERHPNRAQDGEHAARQPAEAARREVEDLLKHAPAERERAQRAVDALTGINFTQSPVQDPARALQELDRLKEELLERFEDRRRLLTEQHEKALRVLEERRAELLRQTKQGRTGAEPPAGADKLERVLERLERLEQRLERLEKDRPRRVPDRP
jgi:RNA polymerase sigma factor (sigma-70 family)